VLKAKLLNNKPKFDLKKNNITQEITIAEIKSAIEKLNFNYKKLDEIDIFNILSYIKSSKKGS